MPNWCFYCSYCWCLSVASYTVAAFPYFYILQQNLPTPSAHKRTWTLFAFLQNALAYTTCTRRWQQQQHGELRHFNSIFRKTLQSALHAEYNVLQLLWIKQQRSCNLTFGNEHVMGETELHRADAGNGSSAVEGVVVCRCANRER